MSQAIQLDNFREGAFKIGGILRTRIEVPREELGKIRITGTDQIFERAVKGTRSNFVHPGMFQPIPEALEDSVVLGFSRPNAFVNLGLHFVLDRIFNINTPNTSITHMGITADVNAVTAAVLSIDPAPVTSQNIKTLGTGVGASATARTAETVTGTAGWTKADANFIITKVGYFNTSTDAADDTVPTVQGVMNIIGGTGGSSPYNEPFTIDLTGTSAFNLTLALDVTAQAT